MTSPTAPSEPTDHSVTARPATATSSSPSATSHTTQATTPPSHSPPAAAAAPTNNNDEDDILHQPHTDTDVTTNQDPSDLPALRRQHLTTGYRAGVTAGKSDATVAQTAFDTGYATGAAAGARAGWVLAMVRAMGGADEAAAAEGELVVGDFVQGEAGAPWAALERWSARVAELGRERGVELGYPAG